MVQQHGCSSWRPVSPRISLRRLLQLPPLAPDPATAAGSRIAAFEQCGELGGLCNATTIGIPCRDSAWVEVACPAGFACTRQSPTYLELSARGDACQQCDRPARSAVRPGQYSAWWHPAAPAAARLATPPRRQTPPYWRQLTRSACRQATLQLPWGAPACRPQPTTVFSNGTVTTQPLAAGKAPAVVVNTTCPRGQIAWGAPASVALLPPA